MDAAVVDLIGVALWTALCWRDTFGRFGMGSRADAFCRLAAGSAVPSVPTFCFFRRDAMVDSRCQTAMCVVCRRERENKTQRGTAHISSREQVR